MYLGIDALKIAVAVVVVAVAVAPVLIELVEKGHCPPPS